MVIRIGALICIFLELVAPLPEINDTLPFDNLDIPPHGIGEIISDITRPLKITTYIQIDEIYAISAYDKSYKIMFYLSKAMNLQSEFDFQIQSGHYWKVGPQWCAHYKKKLGESGLTFKAGEDTLVAPFPQFDLIFWWPDTYIS